MIVHHVLQRASGAGGGVVVELVCELGQAPRLAVRAVGDFDRTQWRALVDAIEDAWSELAIGCRCGHPFRTHWLTSPHACAACDTCSTFEAVEPLLPSEPSPLAEALANAEKKDSDP
jgi:hypothetical protein